MYQVKPIGRANTPYKEKFAVPRQALLAPSAKGEIILLDEYNNLEIIRGLELFSHIWVLFIFDKNVASNWHSTVRPPRLGGNKRVGVLATRAPYRPNNIGMSVVKLEKINKTGKQVSITISGMDLVDGTPIIDIKPYVPYSDNLSNAYSDFASETPELIDVEFTQSSLTFLNDFADSEYYKNVIIEILAQDPRPAYKKNKADNKIYGVKLFDFNINFKVIVDKVLITSIEKHNQQTYV